MLDPISELAQRILAANESNEPLGLYAIVDGYEYNISKESEEETWYIQVCPVGESYIYDGWWSDSEFEPLEDAVKEAIKGAMVLCDVSWGENQALFWEDIKDKPTLLKPAIGAAPNEHDKSI